MIKRLFLTALLPYLLYLAGCSLAPLKYMPVDANIDINNTKLPLIDPNDGPLKMTMEGKRIIAFNTKPTIDLDKPCQIKYNPLGFNSYNIVVTGQLAKNYQCRVMIDTGCPFLSMLSYNVVQENNLPIYPIEGESWCGICYLPYLQIGEATIREVSSLYTTRQWELQFFGIPIKKIRMVLFGLQLMREFRYILFDGVNKELTLSAKQSFTPMHDNQWLQYPFKIEEDINKNLRLWVDIPIEGKTYHIAFDTGANAGLIIDTKFFDELSKRIKVAGKKQKCKLPIYQEGWVDCQKVVLPELSFCHKRIKNAQIIILPDDIAYKHTNFVGMRYFKDTVFVLDFESELLWVKNWEIGEK